MRKGVLILEDVSLQIWEMREELRAKHLDEEVEIGELHVNSLDSLRAAVGTVGDTTADLLIADLALVGSGRDDEPSGTGDFTLIAEAIAIARQSGYTHSLWDSLDPDEQGLFPGLLIILKFAMAKPGQRWVCVASRYGGVVEDFLAHDVPAVVKITSYLKAAGARAKAARFVAAYLRRDQWKEALWAGTELWFKRFRVPPPDDIPLHDPPGEDSPAHEYQDSGESSRQILTRSAIRSVLRKAMHFEPPATWFDDQSQYKSLYKSLSGLLGHESCCNGPGCAYHLNLGNLVILSAVALGHYSQIDGRTLGRIFATVLWPAEEPHRALFPSQSSEQAREVVDNLVVGVFSLLFVDREKRDCPALISVDLTSERIVFNLAFDPMVGARGGDSLFEKLSMGRFEPASVLDELKALSNSSFFAYSFSRGEQGTTIFEIRTLAS